MCLYLGFPWPDPTRNDPNRLAFESAVFEAGDLTKPDGVDENNCKIWKVLIRNGFYLFFFSGQRLIAIRNGKAKWDSDAGGETVENDNTVEKAFSTSAGTSGINWFCCSLIGWFLFLAPPSLQKLLSDWSFLLQVTVVPDGAQVPKSGRNPGLSWFGTNSRQHTSPPAFFSAKSPATKARRSGASLGPRKRDALTSRPGSHSAV